MGKMHHPKCPISSVSPWGERGNPICMCAQIDVTTRNLEIDQKISDPTLAEWVKNTSSIPGMEVDTILNIISTYNIEGLVANVRRNEHAKAATEYLNSCFMCGYDDYSTYICNDCITRLQNEDEWEDTADNGTDENESRNEQGAENQ